MSDDDVLEELRAIRALLEQLVDSKPAPRPPRRAQPKVDPKRAREIARAKLRRAGVLPAAVTPIEARPDVYVEPLAASLRLGSHERAVVLYVGRAVDLCARLNYMHPRLGELHRLHTAAFAARWTPFVVAYWSDDPEGAESYLSELHAPPWNSAPVPERRPLDIALAGTFTGPLAGPRRPIGESFAGWSGSGAYVLGVIAPNDLPETQLHEELRWRW